MPVFKANTEEVSLDLVVRNKKNRPVIDLQPAEVAITDNGAPVTLTNLRLVNGGSGNEHLITLVFDQVEPNMRKGARDIAARILKMVPEQGFSISVLHVDGRLRLQQGFTTDRKALEQAINAVTEPEAASKDDDVGLPEKELITVARTGADSSGKAVSAKDRTLSKTLLSALQESGQIARDQHTPTSLAAVWALVRSQQQIAPRKAIIYFTHCRQMDSHAQETLESITGAANRTGLSIYVIDLKGLDHSTHQDVTQSITMIGLPPGISIQATAMQKGPPPSQVFSDDSRSVRNSEERTAEKNPVQRLAENTGGGFIPGEDSLRKPLEQMIQDMSTYYQASYIPSIQEYDGKFRSVAVRPLRAGLSIRSSTGYFALPPNAGTDIRPFELPLLKILDEPLLPSDLTFHAAVLRLGELPNLDSNTLAIEAPLSDVEIREDANTNLYSAHLTILAQIKDKTGTVLDSFSEDVPRRGALEEIEKARCEAVLFQRHFIAPPGEYVLEAAILDRNSGKASAQRVVFEIPDPSVGPSLSDMVLVRRLEPFDAKTDPVEPLLHGRDRVTADISGHTTRDAKEVSVFFITHPDSRASDAATFNIQMFRNGKALNQTPMSPRPVGGTAAATHLAIFPIGSLPDGTYEIKATISQSGKTAESAVAFTLAGGGLPEGEEIEADDAGPPAPAIESRPTGPLPISFPTSPLRPPLQMSSNPSLRRRRFAGSATALRCQISFVFR